MRVEAVVTTTSLMQINGGCEILTANKMEGH